MEYFLTFGKWLCPILAKFWCELKMVPMIIVPTAIQTENKQYTIKKNKNDRRTKIQAFVKAITIKMITFDIQISEIECTWGSRDIINARRRKLTIICPVRWMWIILAPPLERKTSTILVTFCAAFSSISHRSRVQLISTGTVSQWVIRVSWFGVWN